MNEVRNFKKLMIIGTIVLVLMSVVIVQFEIVLGFSSLSNYTSLITIINSCVFFLLSISFPLVNIFILKSIKMNSRYLILYSLLVVEVSKLILNIILLFGNWKEADNNFRWVVLPIITTAVALLLLVAGFLFYYFKKRKLVLENTH
jgi:hypothetical protein